MYIYMYTYVYSPSEVRPVSLLRLSLLRFVESNSPGNSLWI